MLFKRINLLPEVSSLSLTDELAIWDTDIGDTKKVNVGSLISVGVPASAVIFDTTVLGIDQSNVQDAINYTAFRLFAANTTGSTANDTVDFWRKGSGHALFSSKVLKNQPSQYGHLLNFENKPNNSYLIFQLFKTSPNGSMYHRGGHSEQADFFDWKAILDSTNCTNFKSGGYISPNANGCFTDEFGNPKHSSTNNTNTWCVINNAGNAMFQVNYLTGKVINSYLCPTATGRINCNNNFTGYLLWVKIGRIVFFQIADLVCKTATSTHGYVLFSGLPAHASTQSGGAFTVQRYAAENAAGTHLRLSIGNNSSNQCLIFIHYDSAEANAAHYYGNHWYLAAL